MSQFLPQENKTADHRAAVIPLNILAETLEKHLPDNVERAQVLQLLDNVHRMILISIYAGTETLPFKNYIDGPQIFHG